MGAPCPSSTYLMCVPITGLRDRTRSRRDRLPMSYGTSRTCGLLASLDDDVHQDGRSERLIAGLRAASLVDQLAVRKRIEHARGGYRARADIVRRMGVAAAEGSVAHRRTERVVLVRRALGRAFHRIVGAVDGDVEDDAERLLRLE